jgi:hypothetical protein
MFDNTNQVGVRKYCSLNVRETQEQSMLRTVLRPSVENLTFWAFVTLGQPQYVT